jgi:flagellar hook-basal body complex protein FliE
MSNLGIENLSGGANIGGLDAGKGMGGISERRVIQEMGAQGMEIPGGPGGTGSTDGSTPTFAKILTSSIDQVNTQQAQSDHAIKEMVAGRSKNIHETMLTIERADTSLKMMMQVRNKILDAYREIMRMQV